MNILDYTDYRDFLRDYYTANKEKHFYFSYRYFAQKISLDSSFLIRVIQRKSHISAKTIPAVAELCNFTATEKLYFENLVQFCKAKSESVAKGYYEKLQRIKGVNSTPLDYYQSEYFQKWYYAAIRALIALEDIDQDPKILAETLKPSITRKQAEEALSLLQKLCLIKKTDSGTYTIVEDVVTNGETVNAAMIHAYQRETMELGIRALKLHPKGTRDISTVTIPLSKEGLIKIKEIMMEARNVAFQVADKDIDSSQEIYQMNIQIFPLTEREGA